MNYYIIDAFISKYILIKKITSTQGSMISQVAMQIGTLLGFSIGGKIFHSYGISGTIKIILSFLGLALCASLISLFIKDTGTVNEIIKKNEQETNIATKTEGTLELWFSAICILMLSLQIANFNLLIPDILIHSKGWSAELFGYLSGMASLGAFIASFVVFNGRFYLLFILTFASIIPLSNFSFIHIDNTFLCLLIAFLLGFSLNSLRSTFRKNIFDRLKSKDDISKWMSLSNLFTFMPRAIFPLFASLLIGSISREIIFPFVGFFVFITIGVLIIILRIMKSISTKELLQE
ncbi:MFS transporter [Fluviispira multicolorata]|uniref:Major Facilitator Superfamily protein n=1 Tax=Fluviispira multicolorata TaxID=2654512 RepID=A0A833JB63_9BACT|nr:MFS transporter [Fluviispira multicolorata]KAB8027715.1 hypothetical protein GCL57_13975 [Fluviispira multicolorata]